ncbi:anhydro-N-acetylmuramic acid kinase [Streptomyces sp. 3MP-14]|uniref:Anhydro-N-acetylmuramic acid kinase n=1 Tax=Streptomyces mimosae TaxID=2586635 RepID=A0A5N6AEV0_9ACTN|nr:MULTISPECIES: anhydro-N-acetylmuramic acid kinase [Streptomyces]KAB8166496.1 anhydro-N-acetylmuramic acid kinase [Streptomyces mimosae]KAB8178925.1 anhydro-N-acetylmuramic acid kinase [Streptomyces sp. 3MP-14]
MDTVHPTEPARADRTAFPAARPWRVVGLLSGTSHDAVDAAVAELAFAPDPDEPDGAAEAVVLRPLGTVSDPLPDPLRAELAGALPPAATTLERVCRLDTELGRLFGRVAARAVAEVAGGRADLVASHGQTVFHWVEGPRALGTLQLGGAAWIAEATGLPVVSDFRTRDIARGGQGAPLVPLLDALLLLGGPAERVPAAAGRGVLNLGGIANITARDAEGGLVAYDLGPANALIDAAAVETSGGALRMDRDGAAAARGRVDRALLARLLAEPYYRLPPPKSTGKELFHAGYLRERLPAGGLPADDLLATVTELTAELVAAACRALRLTELLVSGGGVRNPTLLRRTRALAAPTGVRPTDALGLPSDAKEALLFALLGFLTAHGLPGSLPAATGARAAAVLGSLTPGAGPLRLPPPRAAAPLRLVVRAL